MFGKRIETHTYLRSLPQPLPLKCGWQLFFGQARTPSGGKHGRNKECGLKLVYPILLHAGRGGTTSMGRLTVKLATG
jgi:hypothetical protein